MSFAKKEANLTRIEDNVFAIVVKAKEAKAKYGNDAVVDATIGSLYGEDEKIVAYDTVFNTLNAIESNLKASYATSFTGNPNYRAQVENWLFGDIDLSLKKSVIATPGGTGAVNMTITSTLSRGDTILLPEVAWGSYSLMSNEYGLSIEKYNLFEGDHFDTKGLREKCEAIMDKQGKLVLIINDPCHNPTGYSLSDAEWKEVMAILNHCSEKGNVVLLNDIAYLDYSYDLTKVHKYMENFNEISDNVAVVVAFSCSKTLTSYGMRVGAAVILAKKKEAVDELETVFEKNARAVWSNINNAGMENFVRVTTTHLEEFEKEKKVYIDLLKERSDIFVREAKECGLPIYPYKEGFFVTLDLPDNEKGKKFHEALMDNLIFTVKVNKGIRVAMCSTPVRKCYGLAKRMKEILDTID